MGLLLGPCRLLTPSADHAAVAKAPQTRSTLQQFTPLAAGPVPGLLTLRLLLRANRLLGAASTSAALPPKLCTAAMRSPAASGPDSSAALLAIACRHSLIQKSWDCLAGVLCPAHGSETKAGAGMQLPVATGRQCSCLQMLPNSAAEGAGSDLQLWSHSHGMLAGLTSVCQQADQTGLHWLMPLCQLATIHLRYTTCALSCTAPVLPRQ